MFHKINKSSKATNNDVLNSNKTSKATKQTTFHQQSRIKHVTPLETRESPTPGPADGRSASRFACASSPMWALTRRPLHRRGAMRPRTRAGPRSRWAGCAMQKTEPRLGDTTCTHTLAPLRSLLRPPARAAPRSRRSHRSLTADRPLAERGTLPGCCSAPPPPPMS